MEPTTDGKLLIYRIKSKGPWIELCETPDKTEDQPETQPFMTTHCLLVVRNEEKQLSIEPVIP